VVDFCSGAGGPVASIADELNTLRAETGASPVRFLLTDLRPNLVSWRRAQEESGGAVSFVEDPVDATMPLQGHLDRFSKDEFGREGRQFGLYCLAFHHFSDDAARAVLRRAMETFDGFAIIELQDRRLSSLVLMAINYLVVLIFSIAWFWRDPMHLLLTYAIPILPAIMVFDGCVSSLRTREFPEVMELIDGHMNSEHDSYDARCGNWHFQGGRRLHTIPFGYVNWVTGHRVEA